MLSLKKSISPIPSEIYKGIDSVLSFLCYKRESVSKRRDELDFFTEFFFPIIVFDGPLFEANSGRR